MLQLWTASVIGNPQARIGPLTDCTEALIRRRINDEYSMTVRLPPGAALSNEIEPGQVIIAPVDEAGTEDRFIVHQRSRTLSGGLELALEHQSYIYNGYVCTPLMQHLTNIQTFRQIRANGVPYIATSQFVEEVPWDPLTRPRTAPPVVPVGLRDLLLNWFVQEFGGEMDFYNTVVTWKERLGGDYGASIRYAVNMVDMAESDIMDDYASGIVPFWGRRNDSTRPLTMLSEKHIEYTPTQLFPVRKIVPVEFTDMFDSQPTEDELREAAQAYAQKHAIPYIPRSISAERIERPGDRPIGLGDDITVANSAWRTTTKVRAVGITFDALRKKVVGVELGVKNPGIVGAIQRIRR